MYKRPVVAYLRVSTEQQELENQWMMIEAWCKGNNIIVDERLMEHESGREDERARFQELWMRIREGRVGTVIVAELSRLSRNMRTLVNFLYDCFEHGVDIISIREAWFNEALRNDLMRPLVVAMFSTLYELERKMISERTKAGLVRVKMQGKHIGRPYELGEKEIREVLRLVGEGVPKARIARKFGVSRVTVYRLLKRVKVGMKA